MMATHTHTHTHTCRCYIVLSLSHSVFGGARQFMKFSLIFDHKRVAYEDDDVDVDGPFGLTAARKTWRHSTVLMKFATCMTGSRDGRRGRIQARVQPGFGFGNSNPSKSNNLWQRQKVCYDLSHISCSPSPTQPHAAWTFNLYRDGWWQM